MLGLLILGRHRLRLSWSRSWLCPLSWMPCSPEKKPQMTAAFHRRCSDSEAFLRSSGLCQSRFHHQLCDDFLHLTDFGHLRALLRFGITQTIHPTTRARGADCYHSILWQSLEDSDLLHHPGQASYSLTLGLSPLLPRRRFPEMSWLLFLFFKEIYNSNLTKN